MPYSRRRFLTSSATLVTSGLFISKSSPAVSQIAQKEEQSPSGLKTGQPQLLPYEDIPDFLSAEQLAVHHDKHYIGALNGYHKLDKLLNSEKLEATRYTTKLRSRSQKANSTLLHELYFACLAPKVIGVDETLFQKIIQRFGSPLRWWEDFQAAAASSRGWALLVSHNVTGKLYNIISDNHADGVLWQSTPILALDMFEHAYYLDYKNNKTEYIKRFIFHINGSEVSRRYHLAQQML